MASKTLEWFPNSNGMQIEKVIDIFHLHYEVLNDDLDFMCTDELNRQGVHAPVGGSGEIDFLIIIKNRLKALFGTSGLGM